MKLTAKSLALVFAGGATGSLLRWALGEAFDLVAMLWLANLLGSLMLGFANGHSWFSSEGRRQFWSIGFCGGFTTMSGLAIWPYFSNFSAVAFITMFAIGLACYWLGLKIGTGMATK